MTSEQGTGPTRRRPWEVAAESATGMLWSLLFLGLLALVAWPLGWLPDDLGLMCMAAVGGGSGPVADLYRTRPAGRRSGVAAIFLTMLASAGAGSAAASWVSPSAEDLGFILGAVMGLPLGAAFFVWWINHVSRRASGPPDLAGAA
ncbi:hypothetical protein ACIP9H_15680 [Streptomyces sp. NPDC088732]|uniref:hypothetical protein n=1 Tax=Streptomyces sp. NPDC088732 TaxID=3365879 RepID=UPI0038243FB5